MFLVTWEEDAGTKTDFSVLGFCLSAYLSYAQPRGFRAEPCLDTVQHGPRPMDEGVHTVRLSAQHRRRRVCRRAEAAETVGVCLDQPAASLSPTSSFNLRYFLLPPAGFLKSAHFSLKLKDSFTVLQVCLKTSVRCSNEH